MMVRAYSAELSGSTRMRSCNEQELRCRAAVVIFIFHAYLHRDTRKAEKVEFEEANHDLIPLEHICHDTVNIMGSACVLWFTHSSSNGPPQLHGRWPS